MGALTSKFSPGMIALISITVILFVVILPICLGVCLGVPGQCGTSISTSNPTITDTIIKIDEPTVAPIQLELLLNGKRCHPQVFDNFLSKNLVKFDDNYKNEQFTKYIADKYPVLAKVPLPEMPDFPSINGIPIFPGYIYLNIENDSLNNIDMLKDVARELISVYSTMPTKSLVLFANFGVAILVQMVNIVSIESDISLVQGTMETSLLTSAQITIFGDPAFSPLFQNLPAYCTE